MENKELSRLQENATKEVPIEMWGPYLTERQWSTVREDYSKDGNAWDYFPHDHARSRVYRWGEDGLGGISDNNQLLCFSFALWNGKDPILKERLFGLTNKQGDLVLFNEYFHGNTLRGLGASHQTGWTALIANLILDLKEGD